MRHEVVTRAAWLHIALLVSAVFVFALAVGRGPARLEPAPPPAAAEPDAGRELFGVRCAGCHDAEWAGAVLERWGGAPRAVERMGAFLEEHGWGTPAEQRAILDWLAAGAG